VTAPEITKLEDLKAALQLAIGVELSTIPPYLTALYSIKDGHNADAAQAIRSVVMEEMLHMTLAANVLSAIGGTPSPKPVKIFSQGNIIPIPVYPVTKPLISGIGELRLRPFSPAAVASFVQIEHPLHGAKDIKDIVADGLGYRTIGEFYTAIDTALGDMKICPENGFGGGRQVSADEYYGGAGEMIEVTSRDTARDAIKKIIEEGEGLPASRLQQHAKTVTDKDRLRSGWEMYSHYVRFREIQAGRRFRKDQKADDDPEGAMLLVDWSAAHPALSVTANGNVKDSPEEAALIEFDLTYSKLVDGIYTGFTANTGGSKDAFRKAVTAMQLLKNQAVALMRTPSPGNDGHTIGPRFEYLNEDRQKTQRAKLKNMREK
jgi:hypothetical protein